MDDNAGGVKVRQELKTVEMILCMADYWTRCRNKSRNSKNRERVPV